MCVGVTYESNPSVWWPQWVSLLSWRLWLCALQGADHVQPGPACAETWQVGNGIYRPVSSQHAGPSWVLFLRLVTIADLSPSDLLSYDQQIKNYMHLRWQHSALVYLVMIAPQPNSLTTHQLTIARWPFVLSPSDSRHSQLPACSTLFAVIVLACTRYQDMYLTVSLCT